MKINTTAKSKKKLIAIFTVATLVVTGVGYAAIAATNDLWPFASIEESRSGNRQNTEPEVSSINDTDEATQENPEATGNTRPSSQGEPSKQLTPGNTEKTEAKPVKPAISHATQSGSSVEVVATFNTTANGTCRLTLSKPDAQSINQESPITIGPSYYICGFTVDNVSGSGWTATVTHANNNNLSDPVSQRVE